MSTQHAQGRLTACTPSDTLHAIRNARDCIVADVGYSGTTTVDTANARRLVACWNACEGLSTEKLENIDMLGGTLAGRFEAFHARERELMDVRDELLEALKVLHHRYVQCIGNEGPEALAARAAIAKAEGGAS